MKKQLFFLFFLIVSTLSFTQSTLDSLRLVLPLGHTDAVNTAVFSPDEKLILTASSDHTARIYEVSTGKELQVLSNHIDEVNSAVFSPDGKFALTSSLDGTASIYEVSNGKELHMLKGGHRDELLSAVFSPDGKMALTASMDQTARIFDVSSGSEIRVLKGHDGGILKAIFSPNGKLVLTASNDKTARIYEVSTGRLLHVLKGHKRAVTIAEFSPDGTLVMTSGDNSIRIYDVESGEQKLIMQGYTRKVESAKFSDDGTLVLSSGDSTVRIYQVSSGNEKKVIKFNSKVDWAVFSPDSKLGIVKLLGSNSLIFEVDSGNELKVVSGRKSYENSAVFSHDGKLVLTACMNNFAIIYDVSSGKELKILEGKTAKVESVDISNDGRLALTSNSNHSVHLYSLNSGEVLKTFRGRYAEFSPDLKYLLTCVGKTTIIHEVDGGREIQILKGHTDIVGSAKFCTDGSLVISASDDNTARIFKTGSGEQLKVLSGQGNLVDAINFVSFDVNSNYALNLPLCSNTIGIYNLEDNREFHIINQNKDYTKTWINSADFSPNGKFFITANNDHSARIYNVTDGNLQKELKGHSDWVKSAVFNADGTLAITASYDKTARIWETETGKALRILKGHKRWVTSAVFSPDDKLALTASDDMTARIYEVSSGKELKVLTGHDNAIESAFFFDDGKKIHTSSSDHKSIIWDVATGNPIYERIQLQNNNWLVKLPNSPYYMCSKDASKMLHYVTPSLKVIGFEQLDPVYNRPDIVLDSIGKYFGGADQELVANYRQSWEKRIDRLGLDKEKLGKGEITVPNAEIVDADSIAFENKAGKLNIKVSANDPKYPLRRFNVFVNEVPLYGSAGISIAHFKKQAWDTTVSVPLSVGENKIQVSVMNELGLENFKYPTYVNYTPDKEIVAKTHYIGIGVNKFKESSHNLKYCVKDVRDLAREFASENKNFDTLLFTDQQVTKENILALKNYLNKTGVNDKVIISCSSHGLLDDSLNFYLAMHDVDFNNPKARGLKYEELESLLDGIPARQKLLLLDACNSGENDKTELMKQDLAKNQHKMDAKSVEGAKGVIIKLEEENKSNFKKMNELFVNVRNNTGSVIISAAGGQESALEAIEVDGETIKNGAFTYSILECLKQNEGKELKVNTLKQYAEKRVEEITNGKQKPTSRQETMEVDWGVR
jgi:WD40 repeat protein